MLNLLRKPGLTASVVGALVCIGTWAGPAEASTFQRMSLEKLAATNSTIVVGEVVDSYSYWNADGTFILTDVVIEKEGQIAGPPSKEHSMVLTVMGGSVDDLTTVVLGGAELEVGKSYLLFVSKSDLPGVSQALTVRDHAQGVFEVRPSADGTLRAYSQAVDAHLLADENGRKAAPGGAAGLRFDEVIETIQATLNGEEK